MTLHSTFLTTAAFCLMAGAAVANCPDYGQNGASWDFSSSDVYSPRRLDVVAGGEIDLMNCGDTPGVGNVAEAPDFTLDYTRTGSFNIRFRSQGSCDTVLLINDASGQWFWDDDSGEGPDSEVLLQNPDSGYIDVWVGTYDSQVCDASLDIESFDR